MTAAELLEESRHLRNRIAVWYYLQERVDADLISPADAEIPASMREVDEEDIVSVMQELDARIKVLEREAKTLMSKEITP
mgnify:CR=1 FL=1